MSDSILVLRLSALGDILHTIPAVLALRSAHPAARIGWVVESPFRELVEMTTPLDELFVVDTKKWRRSPNFTTIKDVLDMRRRLRGFAKGGTSVDFQGLVKSSIFGFISGAKELYGFDHMAVREKAALLFANRHIPVDRSSHVVEWNMTLARAAGATEQTPPAVDLSLFIDDSREDLRKLMASRPIVISPGAGRPSKRWPVDRYRELLLLTGREAVVVWGPDEKPLADAIAVPTARIAPPTTLRQLAFVLQNASLVIAGDTGPLHLAAALGVPVLGLYGPTNARRNGPYHQTERVIQSEAPGGAMGGIRVGEVAGMLERLERE